MAGTGICVHSLAVFLSAQRRPCDWHRCICHRAGLGTDRRASWRSRNVGARSPPLQRLGVLILASTRPKRDSATDNDGELVLTTGWLALIYASGLLLILGPRLALWHSNDNFNIFTVIFILGFAIEALAATVMLFGSLRALYLDARYLTYFTLYLLTPWLYSLLLAIRPWQGVVTIVAQLLLTFAIIIVEIVTIGVKVQPTALLQGDPRFLRLERYSGRIIWHWMVGLYIPLFLEYLAAWIADSFTFTETTGDGSPETVLLAVGIASLVIIAVLACVGVPRWFAALRRGTTLPTDGNVERGTMSPFINQNLIAASSSASASTSALASGSRSLFEVDKRN